MESTSRRAEALLQRLGGSYRHVVGARFAINVAIGSTIVWYSLAFVGASKPIWAIASLVAASDPEPTQAQRMFASRVINVLVGCGTGITFLWMGGQRAWLLPLALLVTVLISTYFVRVKTMWRQAPITAAVVIAAGLAGDSAAAGIGDGLLKVGEVVYGCVVGVIVSWAMSKVWLIAPPADTEGPGS